MKMMVYKDKEKILKKLYSILESIGKENGLYIFLRCFKFNEKN